MRSRRSVAMAFVSSMSWPKTLMSTVDEPLMLPICPPGVTVYSRISGMRSSLRRSRSEIV